MQSIGIRVCGEDVQVIGTTFQKSIAVILVGLCVPIGVGIPDFGRGSIHPIQASRFGVYSVYQANVGQFRLFIT